jgi:hypothetical protein
VIYPDSTPEFRLLVKANELQILQVRYVNTVQGYVGAWQDIPVVKEYDTDNHPKT